MQSYALPPIKKHLQTTVAAMVAGAENRQSRVFSIVETNPSAKGYVHEWRIITRVPKGVNGDRWFLLGSISLSWVSFAAILFLMAERKGTAYNIRCSVGDAALFERASDLEGFSTVQQWMLALARKAGREIVSEDLMDELEDLVMDIESLDEEELDSIGEAKHLADCIHRVIRKMKGE